MNVKTILVIEDNDVNMKLVKAILSREGYRVLVTDTAEQGLVITRSEKPNLVLMDIKLPGMDGLEATRRIKSDPSTSAIPVVALTAYAMESDAQRARIAGCDAFITKPIELKSFVETVRSVVR